MLLKRLRLRNIRTYDEGEVTFPEGTILFEGGIGSGKSTILLAIEFALFGLGNEKGTTLLGLGKTSGEVELDFETGGLSVRVHRSLIRSRRSSLDQGVLIPGGVKQENCWIEHSGNRTSYATKEMKEAVLKLLHYNEPTDPKAKSLVFRYAVYTPQEEMKEILSQAPEQRLQTIRKALRLEEYKAAKDNAHSLAKLFQSRSKYLMEDAKRIPEIERELGELEGRMPEIQVEIGEIGEEIFDLDVEMNGHKTTRDELRANLEQLQGDAKREGELSSACASTTRRIASLSANINSNNERIAGLRKRLNDADATLKKPPMSLQEFEGRIEEAKTRYEGYIGELGRVAHIIKNYATLIDKSVCPTCEQPVDAGAFREKLEESERSRKDIELKKELVEKELKDLERGRQDALRYENALSSMSDLQDHIYDAEAQLSKDKEELRECESQKSGLEEKLAQAAQASERYKGVKDDFDKNEAAISKLERQLDELKSKRSRKEYELGVIKTRMGDLGKRAEEIQENLKKAETLVQYSNWLEEYFSTAMVRIELSIMTSANRELNDEFGRWFAFLVEDPTKSVRIDEDFTPLVSQDAYEQEVTNLSGGERTALALAYRLALNKTVQRRVAIDSGLLILDEPTDGFSKDQIGKIGDLLKELGLVQAIIVSHERELEGAVDHIFRVVKEGGRSKVLPVSA